MESPCECGIEPPGSISHGVRELLLLLSLLLLKPANGEWRRLHNEKCLSLYRSPNIFRRSKWVRYVIRMEDGRNVLKMLAGKPTGKSHLGRWEDNFSIDL